MNCYTSACTYTHLICKDMIMQPVHLVTWFGLLVLCPPLISASCFTCGSNATVLNYWPSKYFDARFEIPITSNVSGGWNVALKFSKPVIDVKIWNADVESKNNESTLYILKNKHWNADFLPGDILEMGFNVMFLEPAPIEFTVRLVGQEDCGTCAGDSDHPTQEPDYPTQNPTHEPDFNTKDPTQDATQQPDFLTQDPTQQPDFPTQQPDFPSQEPDFSTQEPTQQPFFPTQDPTQQPFFPTQQPDDPTQAPTDRPMASCFTCGSNATVLNYWPNYFNAWFSIPITSSVSGGWNVALKFSKPVIDVKIWNADVDSTNNESTLYILKNKHWNTDLLPGDILEMGFNTMFLEPAPIKFTVRLIGQEDCGTCAGDSDRPTQQPDFTTQQDPTQQPDYPTQDPTQQPDFTTQDPTQQPDFPTQDPTQQPDFPTQDPTQDPTQQPYFPTQDPTQQPDFPTQDPTQQPDFPTQNPTQQPDFPSKDPTQQPDDPTQAPTDRPMASCFTCGSNATVLNYWPNYFNAWFSIPITNKVSGGWNVALKFSKSVIDVEIWNADVDSTNNESTLYILKNKHWNTDLLPGDILEMGFNAMFLEPAPIKFTVRLIGQEDCGTCAGDSDRPTQQPDFTTQQDPTQQPDYPTQDPTQQPDFTTQDPTQQPDFPTQDPTQQPDFPTQDPTQQPYFPTQDPTQQPDFPTQDPTQQPDFPTQNPTQQPDFPSKDPTQQPDDPTQAPTDRPMASCFTCGSNATVLNYWPNYFNAWFSIPITNKVSGGWNVALKFSKSVIDVEIWNADVDSTNNESTLYILKNKHWNTDLLPGDILEMGFNAMFLEPAPIKFTVRLIGQEDCGTCAGDSDRPTQQPDFTTQQDPTQQPDYPTQDPTQQPDFTTQQDPTQQPDYPTQDPTQQPDFTTQDPTQQPDFPTQDPTQQPDFPTQDPTQQPYFPTQDPTQQPDFPTQDPTQQPDFPTQNPTQQPDFPSKDPTQQPDDPTQAPTDRPMASCFTCGSNATVLNYWPNYFNAWFSIPITNKVSGGWNVALKFSKSVIDVEIWNADVESTNNESTLHILKNKHWNADLLPGDILEMGFNAVFLEPAPIEFTVHLIGQEDCGTCADYPTKEPDYPTQDPTQEPDDPTQEPDYPTQAPPGNWTTSAIPDLTTSTELPFFDCPLTEVKYIWQGGYRGKFWIPIWNEVVGGWLVRLDFSQEILHLEPFWADIDSESINHRTFFLRNKDYNADQVVGTVMIGQFQASVETVSLPSFTAVMMGQPSCSPSSPTTATYNDSRTTPFFGDSSTTSSFDGSHTTPSFDDSHTTPSFDDSRTTPSSGDSPTTFSYNSPATSSYDDSPTTPFYDDNQNQNAPRQ
ncbi:uncharacterized protein [Asterias amurensis]|uniref:uncharacterized protein n=1 Tax=Asterias amurensis TaxID=7602 RepID=UPI003AB824F2